MSLNTYAVNRGHEGDRFYREGETRDLDAGQATHLVKLGVLSLIGPAKMPTPQPTETERIAADLTQARDDADAEMDRIAAEVVDARVNADTEIARIAAEVVEARANADAEIAGFAAEVENRRVKTEAPPANKLEDAGNNKGDELPPLEAKHRGSGSYSIMRGDQEVVEKLTKDRADAFNKADAAGKQAILADLGKGD
ncbi:hypothetical protein [Terrihabitans sp. B22-R8]|uniref:hypothetical protein n=1 Tax=Terrihabitans sp. B22-R8 TaxID=3425128 RepID=UPI00403C0D99